MNQHQQLLHKRNNTIQSLLLILTMMVVLGLLGWIIAGGNGLGFALVLCATLVLLAPRLSPWLVLRMYQAREIAAHSDPDLYTAVQQLSRRAGLTRPPRLYYIPTRLMNAFAVGSREHSAIALTDGIIRTMTPRELLGVIAHELSHVRHNDMWVMNLADIISRLTLMLSQLGLFLLIVTLPLVLFGFVSLSWFALLLLLTAPTVVNLLQLALSRTREYDADLGAVELTGDPHGLASALNKLEQRQGGWLERIFMPGRREPDPAILRTHPPTAERIRRLLALVPPPIPALPPASSSAARGSGIMSDLPPLTRRPRWHMNGLWY
jgi:heat shock protein HtpX